jgi:hypothetical protein
MRTGKGYLESTSHIEAGGQMWDTLDSLLAEAVEHLVAQVLGCSTQWVRDMINERRRSYGVGQGWPDGMVDARWCLA